MLTIVDEAAAEACDACCSPGAGKLPLRSFSCKGIAPLASPHCSEAMRLCTPCSEMWRLQDHPICTHCRRVLHGGVSCCFCGEPLKRGWHGRSCADAACLKAAGKSLALRCECCWRQPGGDLAEENFALSPCSSGSPGCLGQIRLCKACLALRPRPVCLPCHRAAGTPVPGGKAACYSCRSEPCSLKLPEAHRCQYCHA